MSVLATAAELGARLRHARLLHPRGRSFEGRLETVGTPGHTWGAALLDVPAERPAIVRVSKGAPTPAHWPDVLGLAIRVRDPDAGWVDLLLSSTVRPPVLRHVPVPRRDFGATYGTLLAYSAGGRRVFLSTVPVRGVGDTLEDVARAAGTRGLRLTIAAANRWGRWRPFAVLRFGAPLDTATDASLAFNATTNYPPDLVPVGWLQRARRAAYRASQRGRGAREQ